MIAFLAVVAVLAATGATALAIRNGGLQSEVAELKQRLDGANDELANRGALLDRANSEARSQRERAAELARRLKEAHDELVALRVPGSMRAAYDRGVRAVPDARSGAAGTGAGVNVRRADDEPPAE